MVGSPCVFGCVQIGFAAYSMYSGHPTHESCDAIEDQIEQIESVYESEPDSDSKTQVLETLTKIRVDKMKDLRWSLDFHNVGKNGADIGSGVLGIVSGGCLIAIAASPPSAVVCGPIALWTFCGSMVAAGGASVAEHQRWYEFRAGLVAMTDEVIAAQEKYARATGRLAEGLSGRPGKFGFTGSSWCQTHMMISYNLPNTGRIHRKSSDYDTGVGAWYKADIMIEPGATNVEVSFSVRGGRDVYAINEDHSALWQSWATNDQGEPYVETFLYDSGDGVNDQFELEGTSLHRYVRQVNHLDLTEEGSAHKHARGYCMHCRNKCRHWDGNLALRGEVGSIDKCTVASNFSGDSALASTSASNFEEDSALA